MLRGSLIGFVCIVVAAAPRLNACTTFGMDASGRVLLAANYDWDTGVGLLMVNKRSVAKVALTGRPARWTSRFASITFNQYGRDFPTGGMNEAGLSIALMALDETQYPDVDDRPSVGILGWIQYQLDVSASIDDVIAESQRVRIANGGKGLHYLIGDRSGRAATIEFLRGSLVAHHDATLPVAVLTNNTYDDSLAYLRTITGFGGNRPVPNGIGSLERFARAASMLRQADDGDPIDRAFAILDAIHQPDYTKWSIVYDPQAAAVYFRTDRSPVIRSLSFASLDLSCATSVRTLDINAQASELSDYSTEANVWLVNTAYDQTPFLAGASAEDRLETALHPEGDVCVARRRGARQ